jgi:hypothetical protein
MEAEFAREILSRLPLAEAVLSLGRWVAALGSGQVLLRPPAQRPAQQQGLLVQDPIVGRDSPIVG